MSNHVEVINIDLSDEEEEDEEVGERESKPVNGLTSSQELGVNRLNHSDDQQNDTPASEIEEKRRRNIDDLLNLYEKCRQRLTDCASFMNEEQRLRYSQLNLKSGTFQPSIIFNVGGQEVQPPRQPVGQQPPLRFDFQSAYRASPPRNYDAEEDYGLARYDRSLVTSSYSAARRPAQRAKRKPKKRRAPKAKAPRKAATSSYTRQASTSQSSSSRAQAATVRREPKTVVKKEPKIVVKREPIRVKKEH